MLFFTYTLILDKHTYTNNSSYCHLQADTDTLNASSTPPAPNTHERLQIVLILHLCSLPSKHFLRKEDHGLPMHLSFWAISLFSLYVVVLSIQPVLTCLYITTKSIFIHYYHHSVYTPWPFCINQTWLLPSSHSPSHLLTATTLPQHMHTPKILSKFLFVLLAVGPHLCEQSTPVWVMTCLFT